MSSEETQQLLMDLGGSLRDLIDSYSTGHAVPVELIVGLLHCIAHEIMQDSGTATLLDLSEMGDDEDIEDIEDTDDEF
jgi:hypothetical protein